MAVRNTPACAGKTPKLWTVSAPLQKHPRLRGEDLCRETFYLEETETPPLARGRPLVAIS